MDYSQLAGDDFYNDYENNIKKLYELLFPEISKKQIPKCFPSEFINNFDAYIKSLHLREFVIQDMGFTLVTEEWINPFVEWLNGKKVLEVMAGLGAISFALRQAGIDVITTDNMSWHTSSNINPNCANWKDKLWTDIEGLDAVEAIRKYGKDIDVVIMAWAYMDDIAYRVAKELYNVNPKAVIVYIGEQRGGCTANEDFFINTMYVEDENFDKVTSAYKTFFGLHDCPYLLQFCSAEK